MADNHDDGGYPCPYDTVDPLPEGYECPMCFHIMYEPQQIGTCGHRFCQPCLQRHLRDGSRRCPLDNQRIQDDRVFLDVGHRRVIQALQVKCLNSSRGCQWTGELLDAERHCGRCQLEKVKCQNNNCEEMIERRDEQRHCQQECVWRIKTCPHCNENYAFCHEQDHMNACQCLPIDCLHKCERLIPRREMTNHINNECSMTVIDCPYNAAGCELKMTRGELQSHLDKSTQSHLDITFERLQELKNEMERKLEEMETSLKERLHQQDRQRQESEERQHQQLKDVTKRLQEQERQHQQFKDVTERLQEQVKELQKAQDVSERAARQERQKLEDVTERLHELETQPMKCNGKLEWRIDNYKQRLAKAKAGHEEYLYSEPFYSGRFGYKLRCVVALNGESVGKGSHLSIFFQLLKGECDALLQWPFSEKIMFTLVNQTKKNNDIVMTLTPSHKSQNQRPKTEQNESSGYYYFASHETIENDGHLKDDKIFIKVEVVPFELLSKKRESVNYNGKLIWRVDNYEQRLSDEKAGREVIKYSDPFYSGRYGYKVRCYLNLNGHGVGKGSHLSIFVQVLQGECDALLPWPFSGKVKFTLINQTKKNNDIVNELTPEGEDSFQRPKTKQNDCFGYPTFASHETIKNGGYLKDDLIFIKVEVKPFDLLTKR